MGSFTKKSEVENLVTLSLSIGSWVGVVGVCGQGGKIRFFLSPWARQSTSLRGVWAELNYNFYFLLGGLKN
jgi:hypothetical protein